MFSLGGVRSYMGSTLAPEPCDASWELFPRLGYKGSSHSFVTSQHVSRLLCQQHHPALALSLRALGRSCSTGSSSGISTMASSSRNSENRPIHQDFIARIRYSNALPPPPNPPKLLDIPNTGLASGQYTAPGFASRLAREQPLNIEADAELGMPLDLVGMPGIFDGDESCEFAIVRPCCFDLHVLMPPQLSKHLRTLPSRIHMIRRSSDPYNSWASPRRTMPRYPSFDVPNTSPHLPRNPTGRVPYAQPTLPPPAAR